jgi:hypothetical protein
MTVEKEGELFPRRENGPGRLLCSVLQAGNPLLDHIELQFHVCPVDFERLDLVLDRHRHPAAPAGAGASMASLFMSEHIAFHLLFRFP